MHALAFATMAADGDESEVFDTRRVSMRIPRWASIVCFLAAIAVLEVPLGNPVVPLALAMALITAAFVGIYLSFRLPPRERAVCIHVDRDGARVGGRMLIRRSAVRNATIAEIGDGSVVLTFRFAVRSVAFRMASAGEAARVLARLHLLPSSRAMVFARGNPVWMVPVIFGLIPFIAHGVVNPLYLSPVALAFTVLLAWSRTLAIGREGVRVSSLLSRRFIGYGEIEDIVDEARAIVLRLKGGKIVRVVSQGMWTPYTRESGNRHLAHHIRLGQRALMESSCSPSTVTAAMMATGAAGQVAQYRVATVPREHLLATAEDPAADLKLRIAAIQALTSDADDDERARLETIGEASASPQLRMAIRRMQ